MFRAVFLMNPFDFALKCGKVKMPAVKTTLEIT